MSSNFGPRNVEFERLTPVTKGIIPPKTNASRDGLKRVSIASSRLVVIRAFLLASRIKETFLEYGLEARFEEMVWNDSVITETSKGRLAAAVYNSQRGNLLIVEERLNVTNIGIIGHSMGGRNFCVLANSRGKWKDLSIADMAQEFSSATVIVGKNTDRFSNLLEVLDVANEDELESKGIDVVDISDASPAMLAGMRDALMVCGQNRRLEAVGQKEIVELQGFASLPPKAKEGIRARSANSLFVGTGLLDEIESSGEEIFRRLMSNFSKSWLDAYDDHLSLVSHECEFDYLGLDERMSAVSSILYETYRIGTP